MHKAHFNNETFNWSKAEPGGTPDCVYFHVLLFFFFLSSSALENCTQPTLEPAHVHESKWQRNISRSEMKCAWVDRFFPAFSVKHTEYILVFILTLWGCHLMQSSAGAFLLNACDLKRFSTTSGELVQKRGCVKQRWLLQHCVKRALWFSHQAQELQLH